MPPRRYAEGTTVGAGRTKGEIEDMLMSRATEQFGTFTDGDSTTIVFAFNGLTYRITLQLPDPASTEFTQHTSRGTLYERAPAAAQELYLKELNRRWRALGAVIKAKLIAVDEGIMTFEQEFLAHAVLGDGQTVGEHSIPALAAAAKSGKIPRALNLPGATSSIVRS